MQEALETTLRVNQEGSGGVEGGRVGGGGVIAGGPRIWHFSRDQNLSPGEGKGGRVQPTPPATSEHQENTKSLLPEFL